MSGGITAHGDGTIVAHGPEGVRVYDVLSVRAALALEIRSAELAKSTGGKPMVMRAGYSLVQACIRRGYAPVGTRTKKAAYEALNALAVSLGAESRPWGE